MPIDTSPIVVCRPALPMDTEAVLELSSHIWGGGDYIPYVWEHWMADPHGLLAVAEYGGRLAGCYKLSRISDDQWWLEGLRVHPDLWGHGIATRLHAYMLEAWQRLGGGVIRLGTGNDNERTHRLFPHSGFVPAGAAAYFQAEALPEPCEAFTPLETADLPRAFAAVEASPALALTNGLVDLGWKWGTPRLEHLARAAQDGKAWWWRGGRGLLSAWEDDDPDGRILLIQMAACAMEDLPALLADFRRLGAQLGCPSVEWNAPPLPDLEAMLGQVGFKRTWDGYLDLFELREKGV